MISNPVVYQTGGGGDKPVLLVTVTGATAVSVAASKSGTSVSLAYDSTLGKWWAYLPSTGTWTVTATNSGGNTKSVSVSAASVAIYETSMQLTVLPAGYTELTSIGVIGKVTSTFGSYGPYIDTGLSMPNGFRAVLTLKTSVRGSNTPLIGSRWSPNGGRNSVELTSNTNAFIVLGLDSGIQVFFTGWADNAAYAVDASTVKQNVFLKRDGVTLTPDSTQGTDSGARDSGNILIFALRDTRSSSGLFTAMAGAGTTAPQYELRGVVDIYGNTGTIAAHYYPARRNADSEIGLYDVLRERFDSNANPNAESSFIGGSEV